MSKLKLCLGLVVSIFCIQSISCFQKLEDEESIKAIAAQLEKGKIDQKALFLPNKLGDISVYHDNGEFRVEGPNGSSVIQRCFMDKELRGISKKNLAKLIAADAYLSLNKMNESDEYSLKLNSRVRGGGAFGAYAGFFVGQFAVNFLGHGAIMVVGALTGPAAPATILALEAAFGPAITAASLTAGLATGLAGAVVTGPV